MTEIGHKNKEGKTQNGLAGQPSALHIFFFSGTGNSANVARWIAQEAQSRDLPVGLTDITKINRKNLSEELTNKIKDNLNCYFLFISPTHGFNYPPIMMHFLMRFPKGKNQVGLMNTRAGMRIGKVVTPGLSGLTLWFGAAVLKLKGYKIKALIPIDLPSNWVSVHPSIRKKGLQIIHRKNKDRVHQYAKRILNGEGVWRGAWDIIQDILISPISILYYFIGRFALAKTFVASPACSNCGLCQKSCGVQAIKKVNGRPFWTHKCESCMHCMGHCPEKAIQTAHGFVALFVILNSSIFLTLFYRFMELMFSP